MFCEKIQCMNKITIHKFNETVIIPLKEKKTNMYIGTNDPMKFRQPWKVGCS